MSRRRRPTLIFVRVLPSLGWVRFRVLRPVEAARRERVRLQVRRVKRRAARRWPA